MRNRNYVLLDKKSIFIDERVKIGENVIIYENNRIDGESEIGDNVTIYPNTFIVNSIIGKGTKIYSSYIENSNLGARNIVSPFSCLKKVISESDVVISASSNLKNTKLNKKQIERLEESVSI